MIEFFDTIFKSIKGLRPPNGQVWKEIIKQWIKYDVRFIYICIKQVKLHFRTYLDAAFFLWILYISFSEALSSIYKPKCLANADFVFILFFIFSSSFSDCNINILLSIFMHCTQQCLYVLCTRKRGSCLHSNQPWMN